MIQCYHCGTEFNVKFDDRDAVVEYCPACGINLDAEDAKEQLEMDFDDIE
jgi:rRNA maturation endonuclease Nob1